MFKFTRSRHISARFFGTTSALALAVGLAGSVGLPRAADAAMYFNNIDAAVTGSDAEPTWGPLASSFVASGSGAVAQIRVLLEDHSSMPFGSYIVSIIEDAGQSPLGATLWQQNLDPGIFGVGAAPTAIDLFPTLTSNLTPGLRYWVQLSDDGALNDGSLAWDASNDLTGPGVGGEYTANSYVDNGVAPNSDGSSYMMCVADTVFTNCGGAPDPVVGTGPIDKKGEDPSGGGGLILPPTPPLPTLPTTVSGLDAPEPAAMAVLGISLLGIAVARRRRAAR